MTKKKKTYIYGETVPEDYEIAEMVYDHIMVEIPEVLGTAPPKTTMGRKLIGRWAVDLHPFFCERTHARVKNVLDHFRRMYVRKKGKGVPTLLNAYDFKQRFDNLETWYLWDLNPAKPATTEPIMKQLMKLEWTCSKRALETVVGQSYAVYNRFLVGVRDSGVDPLILERLRTVFPSPVSFLVDYFTKEHKVEANFPVWVLALNVGDLLMRAGEFLHTYGLSEDRVDDVMTRIEASVERARKEFALHLINEEVEAEKARKAKKEGDSA